MVVKNVKVINPSNSIGAANVYIEGGQIAKVQKLHKESNDILVPGFIDLHIHGIKGYDVMEGSRSLEAISNVLAGFGTTSFAPTLMTAKFNQIITVLKELKNANAKGSNIVGFHLEGPFISKAKRGAHDEQFLTKPTREKINQLVVASSSKLKKIVIAPEVTPPSIVRYLRVKNIIPSIGHSNARGGEISNFIKAGACSCTHLWNGMSGFENRNPGVAQVVLGSKKVNAELICDFAHVDRQTLKLSIDMKTPDHIIAITDAIKLAKSKAQSGFSGGLEVVRDKNCFKLKNEGSIAGSDIVMHDNFKNIIELGYSLNEAVKMTSFNQAQHFNLNKGLIQKGKDADLLVLDQNLNIKKVIIGGKLWN